MKIESLLKKINPKHPELLLALNVNVPDVQYDIQDLTKEGWMHNQRSLLWDASDGSTFDKCPHEVFKSEKYTTFLVKHDDQRPNELLIFSNSLEETPETLQHAEHIAVLRALRISKTYDTCDYDYKIAHLWIYEDNLLSCCDEFGGVLTHEDDRKPIKVFGNEIYTAFLVREGKSRKLLIFSNSNEKKL